MSSKIFSVAILGCGNRGAEIYGSLFFKQDDRFSIAALCDSNPARLAAYGERFGVGALYQSEEEFFKAKRADLLVIATMDRDHVRQCIEGLRLGYDILLESRSPTSAKSWRRWLRHKSSTAARCSSATFCATPPAT